MPLHKTFLRYPLILGKPSSDWVWESVVQGSGDSKSRFQGPFKGVIGISGYVGFRQGSALEGLSRLITEKTRVTKRLIGVEVYLLSPL